MSALKVDDALQAIARLQQEKAELLAALKAIVVLDDTIDLLAGNETIAAAARTAIAHAERAK